jgi:phage terminase small subunit
MPRPRTPLAKAKATGRTEHDPKRFKNRREPHSTPLGRPSKYLDEAECLAWDAFKREVPWLMEADRALVECACGLRAAVWGGVRDDKVIGKLSQLLQQMGATPAARTKVHVPSEEETDPADEFLQ